MKKHILVTGGAGFIGSHLVDALIARGHDVTILDIKKKEDRLDIDPRAKVLEADLTRPETMDMVRLLQPEVIYHFAANASVQKSVADPAMDAAINYEATIRLLQVASEIKVERFVFASTGGALSTEQTVLPTPEHAAAKPLSPYAMHKLAAEQMGEFYRAHHGVPFVALRFANVYGPRQTVTRGESNVIATFAHRMVRGEPTSVNGSGVQTRDYIYVDDVIEACVKMLETPLLTGPFNVGSEIEIDVLTIHRIMAECAVYARPATMKPGQPGEPMRSCLDITRIREQLGWSPRTSFSIGIARTIDWHRKQFQTENSEMKRQAVLA